MESNIISVPKLKEKLTFIYCQFDLQIVEARTEEVDNKLRLLADSEESSEPLQTDLEDVPADQEDISTDKEDTFLDEEDIPTVQLYTKSDQEDNP